MHHNRRLLAAAICTFFTSGALATNGYAPHGIGQKAKGMGGAGVAYPQDALAGGTNPAGMVHVGNRIDLGAEIFRPIREARLGTTTFDGSETDLFLIPEFGYNRMLDEKRAVGLSVFGNGGMNTDYNLNPGFGLGGPGEANPAGVNLMQLFVVPTYSVKLNDNHSVGIGVNLAAQAFKAKGLQAFNGAATSSPGNVTNNGHDTSFGAGLRLGWTGQVSDSVTLGATYQTRTYMTEFDDYRGLFAEQGDFDIPSNFAVGIALKASPRLTVAADIMHINYSEIAAIANPNPGTGQLGTDGGAGFGWEDQTIFKLGLAYDYSSRLTLRAGINYGETPVPANQTTFNVLAPAVVETHLTLGGTWTLENGNEVTFSYMHAFEETLNGTGGAAAAYNLEMYQDSFGVAYSWKM